MFSSRSRGYKSKAAKNPSTSIHRILAVKAAKDGVHTITFDHHSVGDLEK
jgi:hypothetical protein